LEFLILGVALFFFIHLIPSTSIRAALIGRMGEGPFKGLFSLAAFTGLGLIIYGLGQAEFTPLWAPPVWGRTLLIAIMPVVAILLVAAEMPNNIKGMVRHPMLLGVFLWGAGHLIANGDLASTILFASFAVFSVFNIVSVNARGSYEAPAAVSKVKDLLTVMLGLVIYGALFYFHGAFTGMPLL
jgi:uncharacterized membrane protein